MFMLEFHLKFCFQKLAAFNLAINLQKKVFIFAKNFKTQNSKNDTIHNSNNKTIIKKMKLMSYKRIEVRTCSLIEIIMKK